MSVPPAPLAAQLVLLRRTEEGDPKIFLGWPLRGALGGRGERGGAGGWDGGGVLLLSCEGGKEGGREGNWFTRWLLLLSSSIVKTTLPLPKCSTIGRAAGSDDCGDAVAVRQAGHPAEQRRHQQFVRGRQAGLQRVEVNHGCYSQQ